MSLQNRVLSVEAFQDYPHAIGGTCYQGVINVRYGDLVRLFGQPLPGDAYKTEAEWVLRFHDYNADRYIVVTIYDWKVGPSYCGPEEGIEPEFNEVWHVGGHSSEAFHVLHDWLTMNEVSLMPNNRSMVA